MSTSPKTLSNCAALVISMLACCGGAARASEYEIVYHATLNEGGPPLASFEDSAPFAAGTPLTITAQFDSSTADQWNIGAYFYTAPSATFLIGSSTYEAEDALLILLSDPSWQSVGGPYPYSAGFVGSGGRPTAGSSTGLWAGTDRRRAKGTLRRTCLRCRARRTADAGTHARAARARRPLRRRARRPPSGA